MSRRFWLVWSWRDLRRRSLQVAATALVIAMGTGLYAALGGMKEWRIKSNDASYAKLDYHDLRVSLSEGSFVGEGELTKAAAALRQQGVVRGAEERLVAPTQIDASRPGRATLVPGRLVGIPLPQRARIDRVAAAAGRTLRASDAPRRVAVLDRSFARYYDLPASGAIRLSGAGSIPYVGQGFSPQYFLITTEGGFGGEATLGVVYMPLRAAQRAADRRGEVNELLVTLPPGGDVAGAERALAGALREALPGVGFTTTRGDEEDAYRILYHDARNDQRMFNVFAFLILAGAALAAFNLVSRVVESERREIGVGMALGVPPRLLALRPLLMGAEIALLGVLFGLAVGLWAASALGGVFEDALPLPVYVTAFQPRVFAVGAALGLLLPLAAAAFPVWRGVRVTPIEAIRVGFRSAKGGGLAPALKRIGVPGRTLAQLPFRNVARAPRRTLMTLLGLAGVITALVALIGILDTFERTIDRTEEETLRSSPSRLTVTLDRFYSARGPELEGVREAPGAGGAEPELRVPGTLRSGGEDVDVSLAFIDAGSRIWTPSVTSGDFRAGSKGIVIAEKAAEDLGVGVGDQVALRHPVRRGASAFALVESRVRVAGVHPNPLRFFAYMDRAQAPRLGLGGLANTVTVAPREGVSSDALERALFDRPGVASIKSVSADTDALQETIDRFSEVIYVTELAALVLALLMAFNSAGISVDERRREFATMFAYGVPVRSGVRVAVTESMITGILGTLLGLALGMAVVGWIVNALWPDVWPEVGAVTSLSTGSLLTAMLVGVGAVALAPLLTVRRLRRMDIPSTLRVVE
jgi:putative ABC transport system permease protein